MDLSAATFPMFASYLELRGGFSLPLAVILGLVAAAVVVVLYLREAGRAHSFATVVPRAAMAVTRIGIVACVAFLLLRPVWVRDERGERARPVAILVDVSQSMDAEDPRPSRIDQWRAAIAFDLVSPTDPMPNEPLSASISGSGPPKRIELARKALTNPRLNLIDRLKGVGPIEVGTFGGRRAGKDAFDLTWLKSLTAAEPRTALADSVYELLDRDPKDLPAAVVLVTDGRENASRRSLDDLARECARLKVPISVYGVGSSAFGQIQLRDLSPPETLFVDDIVSVPVRYRLRGVPADSKVEITLKYGDKEVAKKVVPAVDGDNLKEVLSYIPAKADAQAVKQELTATVTVLGPDVEKMTDTLTKGVQVVDKKLKVLMVESLPRWDFKFLQRALLRDRRVEAKFFLTEGDRQAMRPGDKSPWVAGFATGRDEFRKELFAYDLLILGDLPGKFWNPEQQQVIKEFVTEGGGLISIAGRWHAPAGWVNGPIAEVLPVEFEAVKFPVESVNRPVGFRPVPTALGLRSPVLSLDDNPIDNARLWRKLPEIYWHYPVTRLKPAAEAFLVHPKDQTAEKKPMPLLAGHFFGKGYVLYLGFDETFRWRFNEGDKYFGRFWSQAVYVAGVPRSVGTKLTQLSLDVPDPTVGSTGQVYARILTPDFRPLAAEKVEARLVQLDAPADDKNANVPVVLRQMPGQEGEFVAALPFNRPGKFALKFDRGPDDKASLDFRVTLPPNHELAPGGMAEADLRKLAEATGGKFYHEEDLHQLAGDIKSQTVPYTIRSEILLWNRWAMFVLIGLLTIEWVLRKFNGLS